jgi:hypothetical protein
MNNKKPAWKDVKAILSGKEKPELLKLVADLYSLNAENKSFVHSRYSTGKKSLEPYRSIISKSLYPDMNKPIKLSAGRKAISDYFKATKDEAGQLELMVHYLETGNQLSVDFGDIDERFYASLESMFGRILPALAKQPANVQELYLPRMEKVVVSARDMGWGYYDYISDLFEEFVLEKSN